MNLSIVVPLYKGETLVEPLVAQLTKTLPGFAKSYEIILVDDGSPDQSWPVIQDLADKYECVGGISIVRNYGQHNATLCGVRAAQHDVIVTMDQDLQPWGQLVLHPYMSILSRQNGPTITSPYSSGQPC